MFFSILKNLYVHTIFFFSKIVWGFFKANEFAKFFRHEIEEVHLFFKANLRHPCCLIAQPLLTIL